MLSKCLSVCARSVLTKYFSPNAFVLAASIPARTVLAYELTDWVRLTDHALHPSEMNRLVSIIERFHPPALKEFYQNLSPSQGSVWGATSVRSAILQGCVFDSMLYNVDSNAPLKSPV